MKSIVVYYSQTGNTKKIAQAIHAGMSETMERCDIARLQDIDTGDLEKYDLIGIGSPVWHRREPIHVMNFIEGSINLMEGKHGFTFCTHGLQPGRFIARIVPIMTQRGLTVIGWNNWYCSVSMPEKPKPYFTDGHPDEIDLQEAELFGKEIGDRSRRIYAGEDDLIPELPKGREYDEIYPGAGTTGLSGGGHPTSMQKGAQMSEFSVLRNFDFKLNTEKCLYPKCTICIDNCPLNSINISVSPPLFAKNCDRCWYCEQICPRGAIEVDWRPMSEFIDEHIFPKFAMLAEEAESKGSFRRLVPLKDVGRHTYWYTVKKPPRIKLL